MKKYGHVKKEIVLKHECVFHSCDMCGREAEMPEMDGMGFEWGGVGSSSGRLEAEYMIDGEHDLDSVDLCKECADWLISKIRSGEIKRAADGS